MERARFSYHDDPLPLETQFENVFFRLLQREELDLYDLGVSFMFQIIAGRLMDAVPGREDHWYDGVVPLEARVRKLRQVEFTGEMWVGNSDKPSRQWKEKFRATVTGKRLTKQGIWLVLEIGDDRAEAELSRAFDKSTG